MSMRHTDLVLLYRGGSSSSDRGVAYPVVVRNTGVGTFWDIELRAIHDGKEADRTVIRRLGPQSESGEIFLLIPAELCDAGAPGVGLRPRGQVVGEAVVEGQTVSAVELPSGTDDPVIDRVPRTADEEATLLRVRPPAWEYLLFAAALRRRVNALEDKYRDHQMRFVLPQPGSSVLNEFETMPFLGAAFHESMLLVGNVERILEPVAQERAFGREGESGDPEQIEHLAERLINVYDGMLDWSARLRGAAVDEKFSTVVALGSRFVDQPIEQFREFVAQVVKETDLFPAVIRGGETAEVKLSLVVDIEDGLQEQLNAELRRLADEYGVDF